MQHAAAFHLGLHCLQKYFFGVPRIHTKGYGRNGFILFLAHLSSSDKVSFCDWLSSGGVLGRPLTIDFNDIF